MKTSRPEDEWPTAHELAFQHRAFLEAAILSGGGLTAGNRKTLGERAEFRVPLKSGAYLSLPFQAGRELTSRGLIAAVGDGKGKTMVETRSHKGLPLAFRYEVTTLGRDLVWRLPALPMKQRESV